MSEQTTTLEMFYCDEALLSDSVHLLFKQHDSPTGLDGADFSVLVHGDHQQAIHHALLPLTGVHQQVGSAGQTGSMDKQSLV